MRASLPPVLYGGSLGQNVGLSIVKMGMQSAEQDAAAVLKMMDDFTLRQQQERSVNPSVGGNIDISV